jgi:uncharacterized protein with PIN domain
MSYWDTSTLVKLYAKEPDSPVFESYALTAPGQMVTSRIALYEAQATFHRKESEGTLHSAEAWRGSTSEQTGVAVVAQRWARIFAFNILEIELQALSRRDIMRIARRFNAGARSE